MTPRLFRQLILAWAASEILVPIVYAFTDSDLPPELRGYLESQIAQYATSFDSLMNGLDTGLLVLLVIATIGLFRFRWWGRTLFLWTNIARLFLFAASGPAVGSGWSVAIGFLSSALTGAVITAMYLHPIGLLFERDYTVGDD